MYKKNRIKGTQITINQSTEGESIERKFERILANKEGIGDGAPLIYTDRADGVQAGYNIRTDRWEVAVEGQEAILRSLQARREEKASAMKIVKETEGQPIQGTKTVNE